MDLPPTLGCTPTAYWTLVLTYVLPPVGALLSATALWVASRARGTSQVALATSLVPPLRSPEERQRRGDSLSPRVVRARKK
jgi:hypothetical protein